MTLFLILAFAADITGAVLAGGNRILTWGSDLLEWDAASLQPTTLVKGEGPRGEGGCLAGNALVAQEGVPLGRLVIRRPPDWKPETIDTNVEMHDCREAEIGGRRGVVVLHRYAQIRFYTPPEKAGDRWDYRELYSIYTPSRQGGLLVTPYGLVAGNYWLLRGKEDGAAWREFAINTWNETPDSATLRIVRFGADLIVAQGHMAEARLARFSPPADRTQLWNEQRFGENLRLRFPHALAVRGGRVLVGENAGPGSRLYLFPDTASPPALLGVTDGVHTAFLFDDAAITVGRNGLRRWNLSVPGDTRRRPGSSPHAGGQRSP